MPSATSSSPSRGSKSGIITTETGERHIPSSVRADGSTRKEIKVRPGYKPPEDVEVYRNRSAEAWKSRGKGGVPGAAAAQDDEDDSRTGTASNKNAKRREARKKAKAAESASSPVTNGRSDSPPKSPPIDPSWIQHLSLQDKPLDPSPASQPDPPSTASQSKPPSTAAKPKSTPKSTEPPVSEPRPDPVVEQDKLVRNLKKKLRQARELREKKESGGSLLPEQFEKVIKIKELIRQLDALGYDAEGEPKEKLIDI